MTSHAAILRSAKEAMEGLTDDQMNALVVATLHRDDLHRREFLEGYAPDRETAIEMLSFVLGLVKQIESNIEEHFNAYQAHIESDPYAERLSLNRPTFMGAIQGIREARGIVQNDVCKGCAFRLGTCANQCFHTLAEARECVEGEL